MKDIFRAVCYQQKMLAVRVVYPLKRDVRYFKPVDPGMLLPLSPNIHRLRIADAVEEYFQRFAENGIGAVYLAEERHAGTELEIIGTAENITNGFSTVGKNDFGEFDQPGTEYRVMQLGFCFFPAADGIFYRHGTIAQTDHLRKDIPHPVAALAAGLQFAAGCVKFGFLCQQKAMEVKRRRQ